MPPNSELRRLARQNVEKRTNSLGRRLGGRAMQPGEDPRPVIVGAIERRNTINRGCASGNANADKLADQASKNTVMTKSEEDDANDRAIAEALLELWEAEESRRLYATPPPGGGLTWTPEGGLSNDASQSQKSQTKPQKTIAPTKSILRRRPEEMSEEEQMNWALQESVRKGSIASASTSSSRGTRSDTTNNSMAPPARPPAGFVETYNTTRRPPQRPPRPDDHELPPENEIYELDSDNRADIANAMSSLSLIHISEPTRPY